MTLLTLAFESFCFMFFVRQNFASSAQEAVKSSKLHFQLANAGGNVTLPCACHRPSTEHYWYKQGVGLPPQLVTKCYTMNDNGTFSEEFNNTRFSLDIKQLNYQLKISNLKMSDSATYYCTAGDKSTSDFCEGTTLTVKGSAYSISTLVHQSEATQSGEAETLNCKIETLTCNRGHSVSWFRVSGESQPGLIYTQGSSHDQYRRNDQTNICEYNLPMESVSLPHTGTYYCAVAACGHILFGDKTDLKNKEDILYLVYALAAVLTCTSIVIVFLTYSLYRIKRNLRSESPAGHSPTSPENTVVLRDTDAIYSEPFHADVLSSIEEGNSTCVYSMARR